MTRSRLDRRIVELLKDMGKRFSTADAYRYVCANISGGALIEDKDRIVTERTRRILQRDRDFENIPILDEDGKLSHEVAQLSLFDADDWNACIDQTVAIAESICRKANRLTRRANEEANLGRQIPFPWLDEAEDVG